MKGWHHHSGLTHFAQGTCREGIWEKGVRVKWLTTESFGQVFRSYKTAFQACNKLHSSWGRTRKRKRNK